MIKGMVVKDFVKKKNNAQTFIFSILFDECALNLFLLLEGANSKLRDIRVCRIVVLDNFSVNYLQINYLHQNSKLFSKIVVIFLPILLTVWHPLPHENTFLCFYIYLRLQYHIFFVICFVFFYGLYARRLQCHIFFIVCFVFFTAYMICDITLILFSV